MYCTAQPKGGRDEKPQLCVSSLSLLLCLSFHRRDRKHTPTGLQSQAEMASSSDSGSSTLKIDVPGWTEVTGHTEYIIKSSIGEHHFAVQHRFSNFIEVRKALRGRRPPA